MGASNVARLLRHAMAEGEVFPTYVEKIKSSKSVAIVGKYICDALDEVIVLTLESQSIIHGSELTFTKTDSTNNKVRIDCSKVGGIDGHSFVDLLMKYETVNISIIDNVLYLT